MAAAGCGGGGGSSSGGNNPPPVDTTKPFVSELAGTVTDGNGGAIVGATVTFTGLPSVTTSQLGAFVIPNAVVPVGQTSTIGILSATATVNGKAWSARNTVEVLRGNAITDNAHLSMSLASVQGAITGTLTDSKTGKPLVNARVFAADGPYTGGVVPNTYQYFTVAASYTAFTDASGSYTIAGLAPFNNYTVTASYTGYINQTVNSVVVGSNATTSGVNFALASSSSSAVLPVITGLGASTVTLPWTATRGAASSRESRGVQAIKLDLLQRLGYLKHSTTVSSNIANRSTGVTRGNPAGSLIETILVWDYLPVSNLLGFDILRSTASTTAFGSIALVRDPMADRFSDDDVVLTPDTLYYYSIARADTINFPKNGDEGAPVVPAIAVDPLGAITLASPIAGATTTAVPTFSWSAVNRASTYTVMVYSSYPNYQSDTDPNAVQPIWKTSLNGVSVPYAGPALTFGQTYYWVVLAQDAPGVDFTISAIDSFVPKAP